MAEMTRVSTLDEIDPLVARSHENPVLVFKHSLTCPISTRAFNEYQSFLDGRPADDSTFYTLVEIQNARDVSNAIAERTGVRHESPQAILLRGGEAVWNASHHRIRVDALEQAVTG